VVRSSWVQRSWLCNHVCFDCVSLQTSGGHLEHRWLHLSSAATLTRAVQMILQGFGQFDSGGRTCFANPVESYMSLIITAGCVQGLLERCAQCTAGAGALVTSASLKNTRVTALPVSIEAHRIKLPGLCHHQAWRLCQAVCWVSTCHCIGHMLLQAPCHLPWS